MMNTEIIRYQENLLVAVCNRACHKINQLFGFHTALIKKEITGTSQHVFDKRRGDGVGETVEGDRVFAQQQRFFGFCQLL